MHGYSFVEQLAGNRCWPSPVVYPRGGISPGLRRQHIVFPQPETLGSGAVLSQAELTVT